MVDNRQKPLNSGFGRKTTASEVMASVNLTGRVAVVTGGYSGLGLETVRALEIAGATVVVPSRRPETAEKVLRSENLKASTPPMDLADLASIRRFAKDLRQTHSKLNLLINNAGIMACPETRVGPGWEAQFACNHIGHFVLANELAPALEKASNARVISLSSLAHKRSAILWDDIHFANGDYEKWTAYGQSKTANALFAVEFNRRYSDSGVQAFSVHPGGIMTPLQRHLQNEEMQEMGWIDESGEIAEAAKDFFKSPEQGCATTLWCATSEQLNQRGGEYCEDCDIAQLMKEDSPRPVHVAPWAVDETAAERLWTETENMVRAA